MKIAQFFRDINNVWFNWRRGFHVKEDLLLKQYYQNADVVMAQMGRRSSSARKADATQQTAKNIKSGIVLKADGRITHGGLSDRLRGICAIYEFCKHKNVPFYLSFTHPFNIEQYLEPNSYDWRITQEEVSNDAMLAQPVIITLGVFMSKKFQWPYLSLRLKHDHVNQLHVYSNTTSSDKHFQYLFAELFRPTPRLQESIDNVLSTIDGNFVGCVFRFQQLLGDFVEGDYETLSPIEREALINKCIEEIEQLKEHLLGNDTKYILITSDSKTFLDAISQGREYIRVIPGNVVHIDYTTDADYKVYEKSFVDLFVLSHAKRITLFKTGKMYHSGFAKRAALISGAKYNEVFF